MLPSTRMADTHGVSKPVEYNTRPAPDREWLLEELSPLPSHHTACVVSYRQRQLI
jgi:hypothetical protein